MMRTELTMNQMEQVNGGYIIDFGLIRAYRVYDDTTGDYLCNTRLLSTAKEKAASFGVSDELITQEQYKDMFGKYPGK